ncbi:unnamed protein product [Mucor fragilis]
MLYWMLASLLLLLSVNGFVPLRKHHYHIQTPMNETEVLPSSNNISHLYTSEGGCGEASLSCMAFGYKSSIPIRCGILKSAPLCERLDPISKRIKCDVFCDTDGWWRKTLRTGLSIMLSG